MSELVSILIPAYNAGKWIAETIDFALRQTWPRTEIIIVDDGSSDNTLYIAKTFESKNVKVITQANRGASSARNTALSYAQGDYIQWLDADDLLAPEKISEQLNKSDIGPGTKILLSSAWGRFYFRYQRAKFIPNSLWKDLAPLQWLLARFRGNLGVWMHPAAWLISRRLADLAGPWDERLSLDDDGEYSCRLVAASERVKFVPEAKLYYRIGNFTSLSQPNSNRALQSYFLSIVLCIGHLRSVNNSEESIGACIKFIQNRLGIFYPDEVDILRKVESLLRELGGDMLLPPESRKFYLFRRIFGFQIAKLTKTSAWKAEVLIRKIWDKLAYILTAL